MSDQFASHGCGLEEVAISLVNLEEGLRASREMATLRYQELSDSESQYSTGTNSPDDLRSLSGTESPYEGSPFEEPESLNFTQLPPLSFPAVGSSPPNSLLINIPTELHLLIFSHLDPLDSTCLGLTNAYFYNIHNALNGKVPISTHRRGRTWEFHGKKKCRHCGTPKCQLHMHLRNWMPEKYEYCAIRQVYGLRAKEGMQMGHCYRSNPLKPERCGRHPIVKKVRFEE